MLKNIYFIMGIWLLSSFPSMLMAETSYLQNAPQKLKYQDLTNKRAWYYISYPPNYDSTREYLLVIALHGGPQHGLAEDALYVFKDAINLADAIGIYPQALHDRLLEWNYPDELLYLMKIVQSVSSQHKIDQRRIVLTGLSMGGGGAWIGGAVMRDVFLWDWACGWLV